MLIYRNGKLVLEEYFAGHDYDWEAPGHLGALIDWDKDAMHHWQSVTKSITSTCIGIAIDKGFIQSVDQSIFDYLPEHQQFKTDGKENITIEHLITMTAGLQWDEWHAALSSTENDVIGTWFSGKDPVTFILERPLVYPPGTHFIYSGANLYILGEILRHASGMDISAFSGKYLFEPLGVDHFDWWLKFDNGVTETAGCFRTTPRSALKLGVTFLDDGIWHRNRIISEDWVRKAGKNYRNNVDILIPGEDLGRVGYGYTWWTKTFSDGGRTIEWFSANGWGGQKIIVIPALNTVVVFTGANFTSRVRQFKIMNRYVIPAIQ